MTAGLKRKRASNARPRKNKKLEHGTDVESFSSENASDEDGFESQEEENNADNEWTGISVDNENSNTAAGEHMSRKPPTGEEIRAMKDAAELHRSNSFKLQIDALLPNVRPKTSRQPPLDRFLLSLHSFLLELPSVLPQHPLEAARSLLKKGIAVPYSLPLPTEETNWKVSFEKPSDIVLVGSWANKVSVKAKDGKKFGVDLAIEIPDSLFQEKDYLNGRFFQKRAFYVATVAAAIQKSDQFNVDISYDSLADDPRLTSLVIIPRADGSQFDFTKLNAQIHIIPFISMTCPIPLQRLSPSHSNIRIKTPSPSQEDTSPLNNDLPPTPIYNTHFLQCLTPKQHLLSTYALKQESPAFTDALTLLRVWANQRGYGEGSRLCIRGFKGKGSWWSALLQLLVRGEEPSSLGAKGAARRALGRGLSSYQLFRAALDVLAKFKPEKDAIFVNSSEGHRFSPETYRTHHGLVFVDSASLVNFFVDVPRGSLEMLSYDARKTLETLDDPTLAGDPFTDVLLKEQRELSTRFDLVLRVDISKAEPPSPSPHTTLDHGSPYSALVSSIDSVLHQALGNRSKAITILHPSSTPRSLTQAHPSIPSVIYIGLLHDAENAFRLVDHGLPADEQDQSLIDAFRKLWGDKAELRRFKDGRIVESVVWDVKTADEKMHIPALIVRHVLKRHFNLSDDGVTTWQSAYDALLRIPPSLSSLYIGSGMPVGYKAAIGAFDGVVKAMKALGDELPLALVQVSPVSEMLRYTSVLGPLPMPASLVPSLPANARYLPSMEIILQFEKSARWPDDLKAIQRMKLAFFEHMATQLMAKEKGLRASVVVGDGVHGSETLDKANLEIITSDGWAFTARIWHDREATLLDRILDSRARKVPHIAVKKEEDKSGKEYQEAAEARETYTRRFIHAPRHHRAIAALCHSRPAFAGTVRLVKRWLASHWLLGGHVSEEAVEILCARLFASWHADAKSPGDRTRLPVSKERGFAAVVEFLKEWKWEDGVFVPLYVGEDDAQPSGLSKHVGPGVWRVMTEMDGEGRVWTASGPDVVAANRVKALAKATWECVQQIERGSFDVKSLFVHPTEDYDFIIKLDRTVMPRYFQNVMVDAGALSRRGKYANLASSQDSVRPGFDPVRLFFQDLQRIYTDTFRLFYDPYGGDQFGGVWDPSVRQARPFRVLGGFSSVPVQKNGNKTKDKSKDMVVLNENGILSEIERLGAGLVTTIVVHA
ncbi:hypothetical protein AX15_006197 [Amanita polypyramis BW_CC]|nr:hypothetical protein AX15_006197 [Amanita polypyramis BW_CC]